MCGGDGACATATTACAGVDCDESGRCWGSSCACDRPTATCVPAPLDRLNQGDFVGSLVNMRDEEGAFDLDFDEICNAYTVTMISGPDYLRQLTPDGKFTEWTSTTNLNMGQVAVLRALAGEFKVIGDIAGASPSRPTAGSTTCRCIRRRTGRAPRIRSCAGSCRSGDDATARATAQMAKIQGRRVTSANRVIIAA